jgi:hypothetical protein
MTKQIAYTGKADIRVLSAADLKLLGVEDFRKTEFKRNQTVEVEDNVAEALLGSKQLKGQFSEIQTEAEQDSLLDEPELMTERSTPEPGTEGSGTEGGTPKTSTAPSTSTRRTGRTTR